MAYLVQASMIAGILLVNACSVTVEHDDGPPLKSIDVYSIPDAVPRDEPRSRYGNPDSYVVMGKKYYVMKNSDGFTQKGIASWYGKKFHGRRTSSGETYDMYAMTAAHKTLPLPTYVQVTNLKNGRTVVVKVNDRGPFHENRIIDLSYTAATKLDIVDQGTGLVEIRALKPRQYARSGAQASTVSTGNHYEGFFIQVGSFSKLLNAEQLRVKLGVFGKDMVKISQAVVRGVTVYRVRIGPLYNIDLADSIVGNLGQYGIYDHHIVID